MSIPHAEKNMPLSIKQMQPISVQSVQGVFLNEAFPELSSCISNAQWGWAFVQVAQSKYACLILFSQQ